MLKYTKRNFLYQAVALAVLPVATSFNKVFADWQEQLFNHKDVTEVIASLTNNIHATQTSDITIKAPEIAENGAVVPITVSTDITNVNKISILVDNNPSPLTSSFDINPQLEAYVSTRVKIAKSSNIIAVISTTDKQHFSSSKSIKVTIGGCGG